MEKKRGAEMILNGMPTDISAFHPDVSAAVYYEVIRVMRGKFLFLQDHCDRLVSSCASAGILLPAIDILAQHLHSLVRELQINEGNVKLAIYKQKGQVQTACYFVPHFYPAPEDYKKGVCTKTFDFIRPDPTIKRWNETFRTNVNQFIKQENIYEALLVNEKKQLTEGSRSNLFFIDQKNRLITAPEKIILPGITRKYVLKIALQDNIQVLEKTLTMNDVCEMKSCFITGTSPKVLPVRKINSQVLKVKGTILKTLREEYDKMIFAQLQE